MLTNATGAYGQSVSEHMFAMMWAIMKNLHIYAASNPNAMWQDAGRAHQPQRKNGAHYRNRRHRITLRTTLQKRRDDNHRHSP